MCIPDSYTIFEAIKLFGAFILLSVYLVVSIRARNGILEVLTRSEVPGDISLRAAVAWKYPKDLPASHRTILTTKRKFCEYYVTVSIGMVLTIIVGLLALGVFDEETDHSWTLKVGEQPEIGFLAFKIIYVVAAIVLMRQFYVPPTNSSRGTKASTPGRSGSKSNLNLGLSNSFRGNASLSNMDASAAL